LATIARTARRAPVRGLGLSSPTLGVVGLITVLLCLAAVTAVPLLGNPAFLARPVLPWWALTCAYLGTESFVRHIQVRREAHTLSLSEIPLVLGLFLAAPQDLLVGRVVASAVVYVIVRRSRPIKSAFNLAVGLMETSVALAVFHAVTSVSDTTGPVTWLGAYAGALTAAALSALAVGAVIAMHEGGGLGMRGQLRAGIGQPAPAIAVTAALLAVTSLSASLDSAGLLLVFGILLLVSYRTYASLAERHMNLERLYRFSQAVSSAPEIDDVMRNVLGEAKQLLQSERASAAFLAADGSLVARARLDANDRLTRSEEPPSEDDNWVIEQVIGTGCALLLPRNTREPAGRRWLAAYGMHEAVVVPLSGSEGTLGLLVVGDRLGAIRTFDQEDVLLLETVANHAGVALRNGELIGQLRHDALHDTLTGLPNRAYLQRALAAALDEVAAGCSAGTAVMILDLDEFKAVNDTLGHQHGDALLVEVGARLCSAVGNAGTVVRLGGDEFAVLLPGTADEERVLRIGRRMLRALEQSIALDGLEVEVGASVGIALAPTHATDPATLLKRADLAMYDAKTSTRSLRLYEPDLHNQSPRRLTFVSELRAALQNGDMQVHVQPKARLDSGEVVGVEALVRWEHPELGWVAPDEFVPIAERSGLIGPLTTRVLDGALAACARWREAGHHLSVAVNLSARSLHDADLVEEVDRLLRRHDVPAERLTLEVTEGSVMADPTRAVAVLHELRDLGVRLSVDDFGTGYSSLSYLQRLPVQEVKIDRSFITGLSTENENVAIVRAIIDLGRHLGLEVVAEGVEDGDTWDMLASMNCDLVQGWHLARAMPTDELPGWLATRSKAAGHGGLRVV
jgi:diguanylate cyclase (GGDEF)-like protein